MTYLYFISKKCLFINAFWVNKKTKDKNEKILIKFKQSVEIVNKYKVYLYVRNLNVILKFKEIINVWESERREKIKEKIVF